LGWKKERVLKRKRKGREEKNEIFVISDAMGKEEKNVKKIA